MNKEKTGILRDDITLKEWAAFSERSDGYVDDYMRKVVEHGGQRLPVDFLHLPESFYKTVTTAYPATDLNDMVTAGQLGVSGGVAVMLIAFDKTKKAAPFNIRTLAAGTASWTDDFTPKGGSKTSIEA
jgi:hypothetical protein